MFLRAIAIWFVLLIIAVLNGAVREALIIPRLGRGAGHVISTVTLSTAIMFVAWTAISWIGARGYSRCIPRRLDMAGTDRRL